jgi:hypothetical protein
MRGLLPAALATVLGAGLVSLLQEQPRLLAVALAALALAYLLRRGLRRSRLRTTAAEAFMLATTGVIGYLTESWGTMHGHWTYNHLPPGQTVPEWVPIAWSLAAVLLRRLDLQLLDARISAARRLQVAYACGVLLPLLGESICIASGVWTYHWPLKILGVPLLALLLIAYAHLTFTLMHQGLGPWIDLRAIPPQSKDRETRARAPSRSRAAAARRPAV